MTNIKLNIDVADSILSTLKQVNLMCETVVMAAQDVKNSLNDIRAPNISNVISSISSTLTPFSQLVSVVSNSESALTNLKKGLGAIGGDFVKAGIKTGGLTGGIKAMYPALVKSVTGMDAAKVASRPFTKSLKEMGKVLLMDKPSAGFNTIKNTLTSVGGKAKDAVTGLKDLAVSFGKSAIDAAKGAGAYVASALGIGAQGTAAGASTPSLWAMASAGWAAIAPWLPFIAIAVAVVAVIYLLITNWDSVSAAVMNFVNTVKSYLQPAIDAVGGALKWLGDFFGALFSGDFGKAGEMVTKLFGDIWNAVSNIDLQGVFNTIIDTLAQLPHILIEGFKSILSGGIDIIAMIIGFIFGDEAGAAFKTKANFFLNNIITQLHELVNSIIERIKGIFSTVLDIGSMIIDFIFNFSNMNPTERMNAFMDIIRKIFVDLPQQIIELVHSAFSQGIDIVTEIVRFIFGDDIANNFNENAHNLLNSITTFFYNLPVQIFSIIEQAFGVAFDFVQMIISFLFGDSENGNFDQASQTFLESLTNFFTELPQQIMDILNSAFSVGIDFISIIVGAIFGDEAGEGFKEKATEILDNLFNIDWWLEQFITGITNIATMLFDINPIKLIIDALFGEGTTVDLLTSISQFLTNLDQLPVKIWEFLTGVIGSIGEWIGQLWEKGTEAGSKFLESVGIFVGQLPGKVLQWLLNTVGQISSSIGQFIEKAKQIGLAILNNPIEFVKSLPGKIGEEIGRIPGIILNKLSEIGASAKRIGETIYNNTIGKLKIFSPGIIAKKITEEFGRLPGIINDVVSPVTDAASAVGSGVLTGFGSPDLENNLLNPLGLPNQTLENPLDYSGAEESFGIIGGLITDTTGTINSALMNVGLTYGSLTTGIMESTIGLDESNLIISDSFYSLETSVTGALNNIAASNLSNWDNINATTQTQLSSIYSSTYNVTQQMASAWYDMRNKITAAASSIQTQSTIHFSSLSKTIGGFYGKLQNPGQWGAGPSINSSRSTGSSRGGFGGVVSSLKPFLNRTVDVGRAIFNPCVSSDCVEYTQLNKQGSINIGDLIGEGCVRCDINPKGGAGWLDSVKTNFNKIKSLSNPWNMKGPVIASKYKTGLSFKVKDFLNGSPEIAFESFRAIAESIFSQINYDFYFNSEKYGNWLNAFNAGNMNCSDSSDALIALARTCGLPATKVHGHWGNVGHFWANIAGHKMDTTGWMLGKGWTPSQSRAGPAPQSNSRINNIFEAVYNILKDLHDYLKPERIGMMHDLNSGNLFDIRNGQTVSYGDNNIELKLENNFTINNTNDKGLDEKKIAKLSAEEIEKSFNNSNFVNMIAKALQERDNNLRRYGGRS